MKKYKLQIMLAVAVILAVSSYFLLINDKSVEVSTMKSYKGSITNSIEVSGIIDSKMIEVIPLDPGMDVIKIYVNENDFVEENQLLAELDSKDLMISLEKAKLSLEELNEKYNEASSDNSDFVLLKNTQSKIKEEYSKISKDLDSAKENLMKAEILYNENVISKAEYDKYLSSVNNLNSTLITAKLNLDDANIKYNDYSEQKKLNISSLERQIKSIKLDIESISNKIEDTKIYSSLRGIVTEFTIEESRKTLTGENITIHGTSSYQLTANIAQKDAVLINEGFKSIVTVDGINNLYEGVVTHISKVARTDNNGSMLPKVEIKIEIINPDNSLTFGYEGEAKVIIDSQEDALIVKNESVKKDNGEEFIFVINGNTAKKTLVETGISDGYITHIEDGINEKEVVIVNPPFDLVDGMKVKALN